MTSLLGEWGMAICVYVCKCVCVSPVEQESLVWFGVCDRVGGMRRTCMRFR